MENKEPFYNIQQLVEHRNENYKLLMLLKSRKDLSLEDLEFIQKLEKKIVLQDKQIKESDKNNLFSTYEF